MSGFIATVLLRSSFTPQCSGRLKEILLKHVDSVTETRKGRHWEFSFNKAVATLTVKQTLQQAYDYEDLLLANELIIEDVPEALIISFCTRRECDYEICSLLCEQLSKSFDGINCGLDN